MGDEYREVVMIDFYGVSSLLIAAALIGSIWGIIHSLARPSNKAWAVVFATCIVLLIASAIGLLVIHAPYLLRTVDHLALIAATLSALAFTAWYLIGQASWAANR
jgi:hypothetical protein